MVYTVQLSHAKQHSVSEACDRLIADFDSARKAAGLSKAELARRADFQPEQARRLFSDTAANPTMTTLVRLAEALGMELVLVPKKRTVK